MMSNNEITTLISELMRQYDANRSKWIEATGSDIGFNEWFTALVLLPPKELSVPVDEVQA